VLPGACCACCTGPHGPGVCLEWMAWAALLFAPHPAPTTTTPLNRRCHLQGMSSIGPFVAERFIEIVKVCCVGGSKPWPELKRCWAPLLEVASGAEQTECLLGAGVRRGEERTAGPPHGCVHSTKQQSCAHHAPHAVEELDGQAHGLRGLLRLQGAAGGGLLQAAPV